MKTRMLLGLCLLLTGCDDSKNPLSDPQTAKPDERLVGMWRSGDVYYHIGHAGEKFPKGVMRVVEVTHTETGVEPPDEYLAYSTVLGSESYLNVVIDPKQVKLLDEKGWKSEAVQSYTFLKYQVDGDKMVALVIDEKAKEQAVRSGKIMGMTKSNVATFTDTTENIARFITDAGDNLWETKEPGQFERVAHPPKRP